MAMYKLFFLIHRRSDFENMVYLAKRMMNPEYYMKKQHEAEIRIARINSFLRAFKQMTNSVYM